MPREQKLQKGVMKTPSTRTPLAPLVAGISVLALVAGCSPVQGSAPVDSTGQAAAFAGQQLGERVDAATLSDGGTLVVALSNDPGALDPTFTNALVAKHVFQAMCESLYQVNADGTIGPLLATALPEISADGLTYTIPLREDAKFSDGSVMTAEAVVKTIDRNKNAEGSLRASELTAVESAEAVDQHTVQLNLTKPSAPLLSVLADRPGMVLNPAAVAELGAGFSSAPSCVGAFEFEGSVAQTSVTLVKDADYYAAADVKLDKVEFRVMADASVRLANLRSGDVQVADRLPTTEREKLLSDADVSVLYGTSLGFQGLHINIANQGRGKPFEARDTPFADPRVRQALSLAIDRESLAQTVFGGVFLAACGPISPASAYSSEASEVCPPHDLEQAASLLAEAGVETPVKFTLSIQAAEDASRVAQALQAQVAEAGFAMEIETLDFATVTANQLAGDYDTMLLGWGGRTDADGVVSPFMMSTGSQNAAGYASEETDALLQKAAASSDENERIDLYGQVTAQLQKDNPYLFVYRERNLTGVASGVASVTMDPTAIINVAFAGHVAQ